MLTVDGDVDDPLKGINVDAAGGASKVLRMLAEKVRICAGIPLTDRQEQRIPRRARVLVPARRLRRRRALWLFGKRNTKHVSRK